MNPFYLSDIFFSRYLSLVLLVECRDVTINKMFYLHMNG